MATYAEIIAYAPLAAYLNNRDTIDEMPNIVRRAQTYITERLDHDFFSKALPATTVATTGVVDQSGWTDEILEIRSLSVEVTPGNYVPMRKRDIDMLNALYVDSPKGVPMHYAEDPDGALMVFPFPSAVRNVRVRANVKEPVLSSIVTENKISTELPHIFETAVARGVALFNMDANAVQAYDAELKDLLGSANAQISRKRRDEVSQRPVETRNVTGS